MFDEDTLAALPQGFDLHAAIRKSVEDSVAKMLVPGETFAVVGQIDLVARKATIGWVMRVGDHLKVGGELFNILGTKEFGGSVEVLYSR